jgi:hypothetical protein
MMRFVLIFIVIISAFSTQAQTDTSMLIEYSYGYKFNDGLYINFSQFLNNNPTNFEFINIELNNNTQDIKEALEQAKTVNYYDEFGIETNINIKDIWGCCINGRPHVMWKNEFRQIPYIGSISHFVANVTVYYDRMNDPYYDPYYYYSTVPTRQYSNEVVQMVIDMKTGNILEFDQNNISKLLARDIELYEEFSKLNKRKKRKLLFSFIRRYNEAHPLFFPINSN